MPQDVLHLQYRIIHQYVDDRVSPCIRTAINLTQSRATSAALFDDKATADVCFVISHPHEKEAEPRHIFAHSKILSARCSHFKTSAPFLTRLFYTMLNDAI